MKKLCRMLPVVFLFFLFSCGSQPDASDDNDTPSEVEMTEKEVEEEVKERSVKGDQEVVKERSIAGDKNQDAEKKPLERIRIEPEEKEQPEFQIQKKDEPVLENEQP